MILRLTCPECKKDSYSASVEAFKPCPYCGLVFSAKYGPERRRVFRFKKEIPFVIRYGEEAINADTIDFSEKGLCAKIKGNFDFCAGETIKVNIGDCCVNAQITWVENKPELSSIVAGLEILNGGLNLMKL